MTPGPPAPFVPHLVLDETPAGDQKLDSEDHPFIYAFAFAPAIIVVALLVFLDSNTPGRDSVDFGYAELLHVVHPANLRRRLCAECSATTRERMLSLYFSRQ
jgi:hypothetical protein